METINWEVCYDIKEALKILDNIILQQAKVLRKNFMKNSI